MPSDIPDLGFGTFLAPPAEVEAAVETALRAGYRHIDCAYAYNNEEAVGRAVRRVLADPSAGITREDLWITSKLWNTFHAPEDVRAACQETLCKLGLGYLDLFLMHWPICFEKRPDGDLFPRNEKGEIALGHTSVYETWRAMEKLVDDGLVRKIGMCHCTIGILRDMLCYARIRPYCLQMECHPLFQQRELIEFVFANGMRFTAFYPIGGAASGAVVRDNETIRALAKARGCTPCQLILAWHLQRRPGHYSAIPKSSDPARIRENFAAAALRLTPEEVAAVDALDCGRRLADPKDFWGLSLYQA